MDAELKASVGRFQQGLGLFGALVIIAVVAAIIYYAYVGVTGGDEEPSCSSKHTTCQQTCRRTRTEAPDIQRCQEVCKRDFEACERPSR